MPVASKVMTETELLNGVLAMAEVFGWRTAHFRPAMTSHGWRTAVSGDGRGFPDLILVRGGHLIAAELKSGRGVVSDEQIAWLDALAGVADVHVWRPRDWIDGTIQKILRGRPPLTNATQRKGELCNDAT
jgi:hypothetical protein